MTVEYIVIPAGTILYRSAPNICLYKNPESQKRECTDTGKHGVYFSTYLFMALAMALEYNKDMELGEFITTVDIPVAIGKYSFRYINPGRYFYVDKHHNYRIKMHITPTKEENISHFNSDIFPIVDFTNGSGNYIKYDMDKFSSKLKPTDGELFITDNDYLKTIKLVKTYSIDIEKLIHITSLHIDNLEPYDYGFYNAAIRKIDCSTKGGKRTRKVKKSRRRK